jgi:hypothetical protein
VITHEEIFQLSRKATGGQWKVIEIEGSDRVDIISMETQDQLTEDVSIKLSVPIANDVERGTAEFIVALVNSSHALAGSLVALNGYAALGEYIQTSSLGRPGEGCGDVALRALKGLRGE